MARILVIDDDDVVRLMMVQTLKNAGHETHESSDGRDAIDNLQSNDYDMIITDVIMPNESGVSVAEYIRTNHIPSPVLAVSAFSDGDAAGSLLDFASYFADATLSKPFDKDTFLETVDRLLNTGAIEQALENM